MRGTLRVPRVSGLSVPQVIQLLTKPESHRTQRADTVWSQLVAAIIDPDLHAVVAFCLIGILLTLNLILRFPDLGAVIEQYGQF